MEEDSPIRQALSQAMLECAGHIPTLGQAESALSPLRELPQVRQMEVESIDLSTGTVHCRISLPESLYFDTLTQRIGIPIHSESQLLPVLESLVKAKVEYDKIAPALTAARSGGYGVVLPGTEEMTLQKPEILKKGTAYGVKLRASAPSIHMIRVDIDTEISPIVGDQTQSQALLDALSGEDPEQIWQSNLFGKSVYELIQEGLNTKLLKTPDTVQHKFRICLNRIVNEGAQGLIFLIL